MKRETKDQALVRAAGEYATMSELCRREVLAAPAPTGARGIDVLASRGSARVTVQVKTRSERRGSFMVGNLSDAADFVVLVVLAEDDARRDEYWVIPTRVLVPVVRERYERYMTTPGKDGKLPPPGSPATITIATLDAEFGRYRGAWDLPRKG